MRIHQPCIQIRIEIYLQYEDDDAGHFVGVSAGSTVGIDHCWTPQDGLTKSTQATSVTISPGKSFGVGYDYYFGPIALFAW